MILGLSIPAFTVLHVLISLAGIISGFVVVAGWIKHRPLDRLTDFFLVTTALTSLTGFLFPIEKLTPGLVLGGLSLTVLAVTVTARYAFHMAGAWRRVFVVSAVVALYFNTFALVAQSFLKVPALHALAPTQTETPFAIAQLLVLAGFIALGTFAVKGFKPNPVIAAAARA